MGDVRNGRHASVWALLAKLYRTTGVLVRTKKGRIGLVLFVANYPIGYGGAAVFGAMAADNPRWLYAATGVYLLSWLMLGVSIVLLGREGKNILAQALKSKYRAWKRFNAARH